MKIDLATAREYAHLGYLAMQCLAAQWLGIGKPEDFCGSCIQCFIIRLAVLCGGFAILVTISPLAALGTGLAWVAYSALTGKGWAGTWLHATWRAGRDWVKAQYLTPKK